MKKTLLPVLLRYGSCSSFFCSSALGSGAVIILVIQRVRTGHLLLTEAPIERFTPEDTGTRYVLRDDTASYLFPGTDETLDFSFHHEKPLLNNKQADLTVLMVMERTSETYTVLRRNRDMHMEIQKLDSYGNPDGYLKANLNYAQARVPAVRTADAMQREAVTRLLCGVPIDHCLAITINGIPLPADLAAKPCCGGQSAGTDVPFTDRRRYFRFNRRYGIEVCLYTKNTL